VEFRSDATGYRLPTEAEWEYCARAGTTSRYAFGEDETRLGEYAWFNRNSKLQTHPVGLTKPNRWSLNDMGGLVYEWCEDDWHENYVGAPKDGSPWRDLPVWVTSAVGLLGPPSDQGRVITTSVRIVAKLVGREETFRVLRGGSCVSDAQRCRPAFRFADLPDDRCYFIGFRVVLAAH
jgi:formylglycine-generating enzyme required for sulfatase activity